MKNIIKLIVDDSGNGQRIDSYIAYNYNELSRTRVKNLILKKSVKLNNSILENPSKKIFSGDEIVLNIPEPKKASLKPYK